MSNRTFKPRSIKFEPTYITSIEHIEHSKNADNHTPDLEMAVTHVFSRTQPHSLQPIKPWLTLHSTGYV